MDGNCIYWKKTSCRTFQFNRRSPGTPSCGALCSHIYIYWNDKIFSLFTNVFTAKKKTNERIWTGIVCTETGDYLPFSHGTLHAEGWEFADTSRVGVDDTFSAVKN